MPEFGDALGIAMTALKALTNAIEPAWCSTSEDMKQLVLAVRARVVRMPPEQGLIDDA